MKVEIKQMPGLHVAYFRHIGSYASQYIGPLFQRLMAWAGPRSYCTPRSHIIGASWDEPAITAEDRCRYDACIEVPADFLGDDIASVQDLEAGIYAVTRVEVQGDRFEEAWTALMCDWLPASGYQPDDKPRLEVYHNDGTQDPGNTWIMDLWLPVKPL